MMGRRASFALGSVVSSRASPASSIARIDITSELIAVAGLHPSGVSSSMQIPPPARHSCLGSCVGDAREGWGGERTVKYVASAVPQSRAEHVHKRRHRWEIVWEVDAQSEALDAPLFHVRAFWNAPAFQKAAPSRKPDPLCHADTVCCTRYTVFYSHNICRDAVHRQARR